MSFDVNQRQRILKPKKKKDEATKALLNFEDMKRKILKDYVKKSSKELNNHVSNANHHRNGGNLISNYLSQLDEGGRNKDNFDSKKFNSREEEIMYLSEGIPSNHKKKKSSKKTSNKHQYSAIYEGQQVNEWNHNRPLSQKSTNTNLISNSKERPSSYKKHTPSKKGQLNGSASKS